MPVKYAPPHEGYNVEFRLTRDDLKDAQKLAELKAHMRARLRRAGRGVSAAVIDHEWGFDPILISYEAFQANGRQRDRRLGLGHRPAHA